MIKLSAGGAVVLVGAAVLVLVYLDQKKLFSISEAGNPVNQSAIGAYQTVTGSAEEPGADLYDILHEDGVNPWGWYNPLFWLTETLDTVSGVK